MLSRCMQFGLGGGSTYCDLGQKSPDLTMPHNPQMWTEDIIYLKSRVRVWEKHVLGKRWQLLFCGWRGCEVRSVHLILLCPLHLGRALAGSTSDFKERDENEDKETRSIGGTLAGRAISPQGEMAWVKGKSVLGRQRHPKSRNKRETPLTSVTPPRTDRSLLDWWM